MLNASPMVLRISDTIIKLQPPGSTYRTVQDT